MQLLCLSPLIYLSCWHEHTHTHSLCVRISVRGKCQVLTSTLHSLQFHTTQTRFHHRYVSFHWLIKISSRKPSPTIHERRREGNKGNTMKLFFSYVFLFFPSKQMHSRGDLRRQMALNYIVWLWGCFLSYGLLYCLCNCCRQLEHYCKSTVTVKVSGKHWGSCLLSLTTYSGSIMWGLNEGNVLWTHFCK